MAKGKLSFKCAACGSKQFEFPNDPPKNDDIIKCAVCKREIGRFDEIRVAAVKAGKAEIEKLVEKAFGKGVKPKWTRR
jgi:DNA-directed RNA polymerase subunit RPC12/RpoP